MTSLHLIDELLSLRWRRVSYFLSYRRIFHLALRVWQSRCSLLSKWTPFKLIISDEQTKRKIWNVLNNKSIYAKGAFVFPSAAEQNKSTLGGFTDFCNLGFHSSSAAGVAAASSSSSYSSSSFGLMSCHSFSFCIANSRDLWWLRLR